VHLLAPSHEDAARRAEWLRPVAGRLGLRVSLLEPGDGQDRRAACYEADIVCGKADEFAFDVLRNSLAWRPHEQVAVRQDVAVLDQIDTVLLDQGGSRPMISAPGAIDHDQLQDAETEAAQLEPDHHFFVSGGTPQLTPTGVDHVVELIDLPEVFRAHVPVFDLVTAALAARVSNLSGRDYEITDGEVVAKVPLSNGVQEAIAVHNGLVPTTATASTTLAVTTARQHIQQYEFVTGLGVITGTAARGLRELYGAASRGTRGRRPEDGRPDIRRRVENAGGARGGPSRAGRRAFGGAGRRVR
jgi:preprotein translocase subunit SecA